MISSDEKREIDERATARGLSEALREIYGSKSLALPRNLYLVVET